MKTTKTSWTRIALFGLAISLALPAVELLEVSEAQAGPGGVLSGSRSTSKTRARRGRASAKKNKKSKKSKRASSRRATSRAKVRTSAPRARHHRRADDRRVVRRRTSRRTTVVESHHHHSSSSTTKVRRGRHYVRRSGRPQRRYYRSAQPRYRGNASVRATAPAQTARRSASLGPEIYVTGGMGVSGFHAPQIIEGGSLPGLGFNIGVGAKGSLLAGEVGFDLSGWRLDPNQAVNSVDMTATGMTFDLKLQPSLWIFEPFVMGGVGMYGFTDHPIDASAAGGSLRLGAGMDVRFGALAVSAQYLYSTMGFVGDAELYKGGTFGAETEALSLGLKVYF